MPSQVMLLPGEAGILIRAPTSNSLGQCESHTILSFLKCFHLVQKVKSAKKQIWLSELSHLCSWPGQASLQCRENLSTVLWRWGRKKKGSSLFPGVGKQLIAFRYFEMKLLPWECFHISPLIMMGRNNEQYSSQNSRNKGNKERKTKLEEQVPKKGLMSSVKTLPWVHLRRIWGGEFVGQHFFS